MSLPKSEKVEQTSNPLALIVGEGEITNTLARKLQEEGCEVIELQEFPKSGKFNYIFQFGRVEKVKDSHLLFLKPQGKFLFIDYKNEDISDLKQIQNIKILRIESLSPWYFQKLITEILKAAFTSGTKNIIDLRINKQNEIQTKAYKPAEASDLSRITPVKITKGIVQKSVSKPIIFIVALLVSIISALAGIFYWQAILISNSVQTAQSNFEKGDYSSLQKELKKIHAIILMAGKLTDSVNSTPLKNYPVINSLTQLIDSSQKFISSANFTFNLLSEFNAPNASVSVKDFSFSEVKFDELRTSLINLSSDAKSLRVRLDYMQVPFLPLSTLTESFDNLIRDVDSITLTMLPFKKFLYQGNREYFLLFQNNMELRATGGFIGSVGFLNLDSGKMKELEIMDVYTIDGQIKGHVDPPPEFRKYFEQANFFLRDSNFDPDFAASSIQAQWFLDKAVGRKVDGVIGINLFMVQDLLGAIGPVTLSDFNNEVITSDNLFIKAQVFINQNFFPGSTQKKDFLASVSKALENKLAQKDISYLKLFQVLRKSLEEKNLLFYFNDPALQTEFENLGWTGRIFNIRCHTPVGNCLPDYLSLVETNFGVNKANYFVNKSVFIDKEIDQNGKVTTELSLRYNNQSKNGLLQGGQYSNYLRLFLPKDISLISAEYDNNKIDINGFDISSYQSDKIIYGILLKIPENSSKTFKFRYSLPIVISENHNFYQFYFQKQAGDKVSTLNLSYSSPKFKLTPHNFNSQKNNTEEFSFQTENSVDRIFQFKLGQ